MPQNRLEYLFDLVTGKNTVEPSLDKVDQKAKKSSKSVSAIGGAFTAIGKPLKALSDKVFSLQGLLAAAASAFAIGKTIQLAKEQEEAVNKLNISLQLTGKFSKKASEDFQDFASSLQGASRYGDEVILANAALIQSLANLDVNGLKRATQAAVDLSSALGIDLRTSSQLLGKVMSGEVTSLSRYGIAIKKTGDVAKDSGTALALLEQKFGGSAASAVNTFAGATEQASNSFGDLLEEIGFYITKNPIVIEGVKTAGKAFVDLGTEIKNNRETILLFVKDAIIGALDLTLALSDMTSSVLSYAADIATIPEFLTTSFASANIGLNNLVIKVLEAKATITGFFDDLEPKNPAIRMVLGLAPIKGLDTAAIQATIESLKEENVELGKIGELAAGSADASKQKIEEIAGALSSRVKEVIEKVKSSIENAKDIKVGVSDGGGSVLGLGERIGKEIKDGLSKQVTLFGKEIGQTFGSLLGNIGKGEDGAKQVLGGLVQSFGDMLIPGLGQALGPIFDMLASSPEEFKQKVTEFIQAIPQLIINVLQNAADFGLIITEAILGMLEKLAEDFDKIVIRFIDSLINNGPRIIVAIIKSIPKIITSLIRSIPKIVNGFIDSLVKESPRLITEMIKGLGDGIKEMFKSLLPGGGGGVFGGGGGGGFLGNIPVVGGVLGKIGFAHGGEVPSGFPNDSFPASLTSGEYIIDRTLTADLKSFLDNEKAKDDRMLSAILTELRKPQMASATVKLNEREFANIILELNRNNQRLA